MEEDVLDYALDKNLIDLETKALIEEYDARLTQNNVPIVYNLRHLRKILQIKKQDQNKLFGPQRQAAYRTFLIPKKRGGTRKIEAPIDQLRIIQKWIKKRILDKFSVSEAANGFVKKRSIYNNALPHTNKELVINLDLKDFFPSITYSDVFKVFIYMGYTKEVSHLLTQLCTNGNNVLPQGSPASPSLSNLICLKLDKRISSLAKKNGFTYTRYADDITISGEKNIVNSLPLICRIIREEGFVINQEKTRLQYSSHRQEVTGLTVNKKVSITKKMKKEIEDAIYYCSKYGVVSHMERIKCNKAFYKEHLYGIAFFVNMIDQNKGKAYLQALDRIEWLY